MKSNSTTFFFFMIFSLTVMPVVRADTTVLVDAAQILYPEQYVEVAVDKAQAVIPTPLLLRADAIREYKIKYVKEFKLKSLVSKIMTTVCVGVSLGAIGYFGYTTIGSLYNWIKKPAIATALTLGASCDATQYMTNPAGMCVLVDTVNQHGIEIAKVLEQLAKLKEQPSTGFMGILKKAGLKTVEKTVDVGATMGSTALHVISSMVLNVYAQKMINEVLSGAGDLDWFSKNKCPLFPYLEALRYSAKELQELTVDEQTHLAYHKAAIVPLCRGVADSMEKLIGFAHYKIELIPAEQARMAGLDSIPDYLFHYTNTMFGKIEAALADENQEKLAKDLLFFVDEFSAELKHAINQCTDR